MAEIPFPTTWDDAETLWIYGIVTTGANLNWWVSRISEASTVSILECLNGRLLGWTTSQKFASDWVQDLTVTGSSVLER